MRGLAFSTWATRLKLDLLSPYSLPYTALSPLTYEQREYKTIENIWDEIEEIAQVNSRTSRSIGQDLFHLVPLFTNPDYIMESWHYDIIHEYNLMKSLNLSLGTIWEQDARTLEYYTIVHNELNAIQIYESKK